MRTHTKYGSSRRDNRTFDNHIGNGYCLATGQLTGDDTKGYSTTSCFGTTHIKALRYGRGCLAVLTDNHIGGNGNRLARSVNDINVNVRVTGSYLNHIEANLRRGKITTKGSERKIDILAQFNVLVVFTVSTFVVTSVLVEFHKDHIIACGRTILQESTSNSVLDV